MAGQECPTYWIGIVRYTENVLHSKTAILNKKTINRNPHNVTLA